MKRITTTLALLLLACDPETLADLETGLGTERDGAHDGGDAGLPPTAGAMWEPCRFVDIEVSTEEVVPWGCDGGPGVLACAKPLHDGPQLSMCVPYQTLGGTEDCPAAVYDGEPFGLGFKYSSLCVPLCADDADCLDGMECSANGMCGWAH